MLSLANDLVSHAARFIASARDDAGLWTISARGRIVGALSGEAGCWRLSWFNAADPRLCSFAGAIDGDVEALSEALSARLGAPVRFEPVAG